MGQLGFFDADKRLEALSARGDPLEAIDHLVPWESFRAEIEAVVLTPDELKKSSAGRKPFDAILMFRMLVLQALNNLSDEQLEYQVRDRLSFSRFLGLAIEDSIPDATTLWLFREKLAKAGLIEKLFDRFDQHLAAKGYMARGGQIIDASIVPVPTQRNTRDENAELQAGRTPAGWKQRPAKLRQKDRDARWTKKHGRSFFGYKNHVNADAKHKLIRHYAVTDAAVHDSQELDGLLDEGNTCNDVFADSAYRSAEIEAKLRASGYKSRFIDAVGATTLCLRRNSERTTPRAGYALASSMCSGRSRARRAVGSCERSAWCGRAPRSACRIWPTTFAAWSHWNGSPRHEGGGVVGSVPTEAAGGKREAVTTANQSKIGPNPNLCPIRRQNRPLFEVPSCDGSAIMDVKRAAVIGATICSMFAVFGIGVAAQFWRVLPVADQWGMVAFYRAKAEHGLTFADLIAPHNEHRLALVRVAFLVDYDCFQGTSIFATLILVLSNLALGGMIGVLATAGLSAAQRLFAMGLAMAFFVSPVQIENVILPIHMGFPLVCILAILAFACVAYAAAEQSLDWIYSLVGFAATALCPYAMANGVIAAAMAVALAWMLPVKASVRMSVTVAAFAAIATYLWGLQLPNELHATAMSAHGILDAITFFLALIGLPGASAPRIFGGVPAAVLVGIAGVTVWSAVLLRLLEAWRRRCAVDANTIALFSASTFILLTAIMITLGRAGGGPVQALSTRYGTFSLMFWASLISTTWRIMPGPGPHSRLARRGTALAATLLILLSYLAWFRVAGPSYARAAAADMVSAELRAGHFDPAHVSLVYPRPHEIRDEIEFLRRHHLSIFAQ